MNVQVGLRSGDDVRQFAIVLLLHILESKDSGGLLVHNAAETGLALHNDVGDTHLAAESGEEDDELNGVDIIGDDNERCLLCLNEGDDMVKTVLDEERLLGRVGLVLRLTLSSRSGGRSETVMLLLLGLGAVPKSD